MIATGEVSITNRYEEFIQLVLDDVERRREAERLFYSTVGADRLIRKLAYGCPRNLARVRAECTHGVQLRCPVHRADLPWNVKTLTTNAVTGR